MGLVSSQLPKKRIASLCHELHMLYEAGIPVLRIFELLAGQRRQRRIRDILIRTADRIREGATLGEALRPEARYFPQFVVEMIASGDAAGVLATVLRDLAAYYDELVAIRRAFIRGLVYPACILAGALFIIPYFKEAVTCLFVTHASLGEYTLHFVLTRIRGWGPPIVILIVLARLGILKWLWAPIGTHVPPFSTLTRKFAIARFFRCMAILLDAGMDTIRAIERAAAVTSNPFVRNDLLKAVPIVQSGGTLEDAFAGSDYLPPVAHQMIVTGEASGCLDDSLLRLSKSLLDEAYHTLKVISLAIETAVFIMLIPLTLSRRP
ncbi:MAG: type II secretion system F family protein [Candidatus Hydrogenedentes bacterium]|nr:type II secretion system F family protein [Candidatus Hydrogenedentota bacterium]